MERPDANAVSHCYSLPNLHTIPRRGYSDSHSYAAPHRYTETYSQTAINRYTTQANKHCRANAVLD